MKLSISSFEFGLVVGFTVLLTGYITSLALRKSPWVRLGSVTEIVMVQAGVGFLSGLAAWAIDGEFGGLPLRYQIGGAGIAILLSWMFLTLNWEEEEEVAHLE